MLPVDWPYPSMRCSQLVCSWYVGNHEDNVPPPRRLESADVIHLKNGPETLRMMKLFMGKVEEKVIAANLVSSYEKKWNIAVVSNLWGKVNNYIVPPSDESQGNAELSWETFYSKITKSKKI